MDVGRSKGEARNGVVAGSVWESRMKIDEVKGGIKVFNGEENNEEPEIQVVHRKLKPNQPGGASGKRKTWKSENFEGFEKNPIQIAKGKSESHKNPDEQFNEPNVVDGIKKSPVQTRKARSEATKELTASVDGVNKSPIQIKKTRSGATKELSVSFDGADKSPIQLRKTRSEVTKELNVSLDRTDKSPIQVKKTRSASIKGSLDETEKGKIQLRKSKSESNKAPDELGKVLNTSCDEIEKTPIQEVVISGSLSNVAQVKSPPKQVPEKIEEDNDDNDYGDAADDDNEDVDEEIEVEIEKKFDIKEIIPEQKPKKVVNEEKEKINQIHEKPVSISYNVNKLPHVSNSSLNYPNSRKPTPISVSYQFQRFPQTQNKLQNLVDLIMWRDVSKSAFVFGIGTFIMLSSSFTKDVNFSFISVVSYLGLIYLAAIFLYKSVISRGAVEFDSIDDYVIGEEEAVWLLKLMLPYLNDVVLTLKSLFSGDPATTMKLGVLLFILARCGSSITVWKMAKLGFFGVFTVPKICSSYSTQLTAYGKFWVRRFRDAWESCSHKKVVAFGVFTLVWNLSSIVARVWAVFMLFAAVRYYQQSMIKDDDWAEEEPAVERQVRGQRQRRGPTLGISIKEKKAS